MCPYNPTQRLTAIFLLLSFSLQSCISPLKLVYEPLSKESELYGSAQDAPTLHPTKVLRKAEIAPYKFIASSKEAVTFFQEESVWKANIQDPWIGTSFAKGVPVVCELQEDLGHMLQRLPQEASKQRIHILNTLQGKRVYVGNLGLKGGMQPAIGESSSLYVSTQTSVAHQLDEEKKNYDGTAKPTQTSLPSIALDYRARLMDPKHLPGLKELVKKLGNFNNTKTQEAFNNFTCAFQKFHDSLFMYHKESINHSNPNKFLEEFAQIGKEYKSMNFHQVIFNILQAEDSGTNDDKLFLQLCPFLPQIAILYDATVPHIEEKALKTLVTVHQELEKLIYEYEYIGPLLELQQIAKAISIEWDILQRIGIKNIPPPQDLFNCFGKKVKEIPYSVRTKEPYNKVNWKVFEILPQLIARAEYNLLVRDSVELIKQDFSNVSDSLEKLIVHAKRKYDPSLSSPALSSVSCNTLQKITDVFEDTENLTMMLQYLKGLTSLPADRQLAKLSILRTLIVLGEASKNMSKKVKENIPILYTLEAIRDGIVHPRGPIRDTIDKLLSEQDTRLIDLASSELHKLCFYLKRLQKATQDDTQVENTALEEFRAILALVNPLTKEYRLTLAERDKLIKSLPEASLRDIEKQKEELKAYLDGTRFPENKDTFITLVENLGPSKNQAKKLFAKLLMLKKISEAEREMPLNPADEAQIATFINDKVLAIKETEKEKIISKKDTIDLQAFKSLLDTRKKNSEISEEAKKALLEKIDKNRDLEKIKEKLLAIFVEQTDDMISQQTLESHLNILGITSGERKLWIKAADKFSDKKEEQKKDVENEDNNYILLVKSIQQHVGQIKGKIAELKAMTLTAKGDFIDLEAFKKNAHLMRACEYLLTLFLDSMQALKSNIEEVKDPLDPRAWSIFLKHPVEELLIDIEGYIKQRNDLCHLHDIYNRPIPEVVSLTGGRIGIAIPISIPYVKLYNFIDHVVYGRLYDYGVIVTETEIKKGPVRGVSLGYRLDQVESLAKELQCTINTFNELPKSY